MKTWNQDTCTAAWNFAARVHNGQLVPGTTLPYITHIGSVAMTVMNAIATGADIASPDLAVQCALLHDVVEDTAVTGEEVRDRFGAEVAAGVLALTKDKALPSKQEQMADSLRRIQARPVEVWLVKLADRITNLQPPPPHWPTAKAAAYRQEAMTILAALGPADFSLAALLQQKIDEYARYCRARS